MALSTKVHLFHLPIPNNKRNTQEETNKQCISCVLSLQTNNVLKHDLQFTVSLLPGFIPLGTVILTDFPLGKLTVIWLPGLTPFGIVICTVFCTVF